MSSTHVLITTPFGLRQFRVRPWHRWLVTTRSLALDAALAAGRHPDRDRWLALRAATLIDPAFRDRAAHNWRNVVRRAQHPSPTVRANAEAILAAAPDIAELVVRLQAPRPVTARGMAHAHLLLTDGTGPVHHRTRDDALAAAIRACLRELEPSRADYELSA